MRLSNIPRVGKKRFLLGLIGAILLISLVLILKNKIDDTYSTNRLHELGGIIEPSGDTIADFAYCWDISSHCGKVLVITTDKSIEAFTQQMETLPLELGYSGYEDGNTIFTKLDISAGKLVLVDGKEYNPLSKIKQPEAFRWNFIDNDGKNILIAYYHTSDTESTYVVDGKNIEGNLLSIMVQTK